MKEYNKQNKKQTQIQKRFWTVNKKNAKLNNELLLFLCFIKAYLKALDLPVILLYIP